MWMLISGRGLLGSFAGEYRQRKLVNLDFLVVNYRQADVVKALLDWRIKLKMKTAK